MRLATTTRGIRGLRKVDPSIHVYMYLFLWDEGVKTELEYRVLCPPPIPLSAGR